MAGITNQASFGWCELLSHRVPAPISQQIAGHQSMASLGIRLLRQVPTPHVAHRASGDPRVAEGSRWGWQFAGWPSGGGRGSQASNHSVQGGVAPRAHWRPRSRGWGGPTLAGRVAGGRHPHGPGGLSARACPAWSLAEPAAGGTGTKWPSPLGRVSGPEPRGLRFRFQSQPVRQSWVDQAASSNQGAKAPRDSPTPCFCWSQEGTPWGSGDPRDS